MAQKDYLDKLIELFTPEIAAAFRLAISDITNTAILKAVTTAIELGDPLAAFRALGYSDAAMRPLTAALERTFEAGGIGTGETFPKRLYTPQGATVFRFDIRNSRAEKWIRELSGTFITLIENDAMVAVRNVMFDGLAAGRNPRSTALDMIGRYNPVTKMREGGVIGLNVQQERAVANMRLDLENLDTRYFTRKLRDKRFDGTIKKLFNEGKVSVADVNRLTGRYKDNLLRLRGETIARDGAMEALNRSEWEAIKQAEDMGAVKDVKRHWDSAGPDGRTRDDHLAMDAKPPVGMNEAFTFPDGTQAMYPQDRSLNAPAEQVVNCRCRSRTEIDWLKDLS